MHRSHYEIKRWADERSEGTRDPTSVEHKGYQGPLPLKGNEALRYLLILLSPKGLT